jgi:predicted CxxxxCH...CXXCH cytochrome family protein
VAAYTGYQSNLIPVRITNFKQLAECYECHTFPPTDVTQGTTVRNPYAGAVVGDHERVSHVPNKSEAACEICHGPGPGGDNNHQDGIVDINTTIYDGGSYSRSSFTHTNNPTMGTCGNVSCHIGMAPEWGVDTISCADCHDKDLKGARRDIVGANGDLLNSTINSKHIHNTTAFADSSCEVCHLRSTHTREGDPQVKLFNGDTGEEVQYDGTGASATPACVSCHDSDGVARMGQNAFRPFFASGDESAPPDIGWKAGVSAHDVAENIASDKCLACHGNEEARLINTTLDPAKNAHGSSEVALLMFSYDSNASQTYCYSCHDGTGAQRDIKSSFGAIYNHASQGKEHCMDCHEPHKAEAGLHTPGLGVPSIGPVLKGTKYNEQEFSYEYEVCLRTGCHDQTQAKTFTDSDTDADTDFGGGSIYATNWGTIPDIQTQFDTSNLAYHPLFKKGRNQPTNDLNTAWTDNADRKASGEGLDHLFVDGWSAASLVTCTDCHDNWGNGNSGARGPHGSSREWILKGVDSSVTVTTAGSGTLSPNSAASASTVPSVIRNFCVNCHRADAYGDGNSTASNTALSRFGHSPNGSCYRCAVDGDSGGQGFTACMNCHGGSQVAGIHGTSLQTGTVSGTYNMQQGKRFMNGNNWAGHSPGFSGGEQMTCYTGTPNGTDPMNGDAIGTFASACNQHSGGVNHPRNYAYGWQ